jgi:hypothetical protein
MQASGIPTKFANPFAVSAAGGYTREVPNTTADANAASLTLGFPPNTFLPIGAGGAPPDGRDFNGLLNQITAWNQWQQAGGTVGYDAAFSAEIGGYPLGAVISAATIGNFWISAVDNNVTDPDTGGGGWFGFYVINTAPSVLMTPGAGNYTTISANFLVEGWSAGGGAGGSDTNNIGSGGTAGTYGRKLYTGMTVGAVIPYVIGAGGAFGTAGGGNGTVGGNTTFGTVGVGLMTLFGGPGNLGNSGQRGVRAANPTGCDFYILGQNGAAGILATASFGGVGGSAPLGGGGGQGSSGGAGEVGIIPGGGGSGGAQLNVGGPGAGGGLIITPQ